MSPTTEMLMKNVLPYNQLEAWHPFEPNQNHREDDYYECLVECTDTRSACKRICKEVLDY